MPTNTRENKISVARSWVYVTLAVGGILFGAGGMSVGFQRDIRDLQASRAEQKQKVQKLEECVNQLDKTQALILQELKGVNAQLGRLVQMADTRIVDGQ